MAKGWAPLYSERPQREDMDGKRSKDPVVSQWLLTSRGLSAPRLALWVSGHVLWKAKGGFDLKPVKVSARVPINLSEIWVSAKNDYCQEQILFFSGVCNRRKWSNRSFVFHFLFFLKAQPLLDQIKSILQQKVQHFPKCLVQITGISTRFPAACLASSVIPRPLLASGI